MGGKFNQKILDHTKTYATDALKTASKKQFEKQKKQWCLIGNKRADRTTKVSPILPMSETVTNEHDKK